MLEIMFGTRVRDKDRMMHTIEVQDIDYEANLNTGKALKKLESGEISASEKKVCSR